jgi:hypothetical protein
MIKIPNGSINFCWKHAVTVVLILLVLSMMALFGFKGVDAQLLPIPGPIQGKLSEKDKAAANDYQPPEITIVTEKLKIGKNVFKIRISDSSNIDFCTIKYAKSGTARVADCVYDHADLYKSLIDVKSQEQRIEIHAEDGNGNSATRIVKLPVEPQPSIFQVIIDGILS